MRAAQRIECLKIAIEITKSGETDPQEIALLERAIENYRRIVALIDDDASLDDVDDTAAVNAVGLIKDIFDE